MPIQARHHILGPLNTERHGHVGPAMAFVHPNPADLAIWTYQMTHFSSWFRTIGIDLPGYGRSPRALPGLTMTDLARACWDAADAAADAADAAADAAADVAVGHVAAPGAVVAPSGVPTVLAGCSVGAHVALHMAHERPEQTAAVILSGTSYREEKTYCLERIATYQQRGLDFRRDYFLEILGPSFRASPLGQYFADLTVERNDTADVDSIIEMFRALYPRDPDWLFDVAAPVLIISGTEDRAHEPAKVLQARIRGAEFRALEGAGHACQLEQPWAWDALAIDFLRRKGVVPVPQGSGPDSGSGPEWVDA